MKLLLHAGYRFSDEQRSDLAAASPGIACAEVESGAIDRVNGAGVTVLVTEQAPRDLSTWRDLRWVQLLSAGANHLNDHPLLRTGVTVTTASGTHGVPIAQFVTGMWLMMAHRMPELLEFKRSRVWPDRGALAGFTLRGLTAGIIGYGSIGRECARQLAAFGMRVTCMKRDPANRRDDGYNAWPGTGDPDGTIPEAWFGPGQLAAMLPLCDLVVVTVPSTPRTQGMIGRTELAWLRNGARLIIVSRGGIVEEGAIGEALRSGRIGGAAVDCFVREPLPPEHPFFDAPNLILTPHMSGVYDGFWPAMVGLLAENLRRFGSGAPLLNQLGGHGY